MARGRTAGAILLLLVATPAGAHLVSPDSPLYDTLRHPLFELPHVATMLALGLWAGQQAPRTGWAMLAAFVLATAGGAGAAAFDLLPPLRPIAVALSTLALGALAALRLPAPLWIAAPLALAAGLYQGAIGSLAHWQGGTGPYPPGDLAVAALVLPLAAFQLVQRLEAGWLQIAFRVLASWIAASGILLLALLVRLR